MLSSELAWKPYLPPKVMMLLTIDVMPPGIETNTLPPPKPAVFRSIVLFFISPQVESA